MELIDKSAIVAEINRLIAELVEKGEDTMFEQGRISAFEDAKLFLDTLEMKGVDLEKHLKEDIEDVLFDLNGVAVKGATHYLTVEDVKDIAQHFFELGLKAQKGK